MIFKSKNHNEITKIVRFYAHTKPKSNSKANSYSKTVLLPQTKLPLRLEGKKLIERDTRLINESDLTYLYEWQKTGCKEPEFILHDGPPYANGIPHMGHVINKVLKDTIVRSKIMRGQKVHYVPGWDCHGLPIELKAVTQSTTSLLTPIEIRQRARNFAKQTISKQMKAFQSWGVTGDWENCYKTFNNSYIKNQMQVFCDLYEQNLVYRDVKPVYWSPSTRTALAEAELEYNENHKSTAVTVKLRLHNVPEQIVGDKNIKVYALIWTTTPWTLPSNEAVCFNPNLMYSIVQDHGKEEHFILATNLVENLCKNLNCNFKILNTFEGKLLERVTYFHPLLSHTILPFVPSDHATEAKGTGLVHTAPAHGPEDFLIGLKNSLPIKNLVDEAGCYTTAAGSHLAGLFVLKEGTEAVLSLIGRDIIHSEEFYHSYPYDWRTKQPVIIRSSKQWFIDTDSLKDKAIEILNDVEVIPKIRSEVYKNSLVTQLKKRPYWCISRQRYWGAPIPVLYEGSNENPIVSRKLINHLGDLLDKYGPDYWWNFSENVLLPNDLIKTVNVVNLKKGQDIFDIWFDSGLSWYNALDPLQIADMYLEGVDQFTGWFQSSLLTSVALRNRAPYKAIYVHGFAVDDKGLKMSKSLGNVVDPLDIMQGKNDKKPYGVDALRWWVVCHASFDSTAQISANVLQASADEVHKIRSVLRFAIGALFDYTAKPLDYNSLLLIDKYLLHLLSKFQGQVSEIYNNYEFNKLAPCVINFLTTPVSALYYLAIKDRLYCNRADSSERRAAQYVLLQLFEIVTKSVAPVVPHLAEELYSYLPQKNLTSIFQNPVANLSPQWCNPQLAAVMENVLLEIKKDIHKEVGANTVSSKVTVTMCSSLINELKSHQEDLDQLSVELSDIYQISELSLVANNETEKYGVAVEQSNLFTCDRCRRVSSKTENELCYRCHSVIVAMLMKNMANIKHCNNV